MNYSARGHIVWRSRPFYAPLNPFLQEAHKRVGCARLVGIQSIRESIFLCSVASGELIGMMSWSRFGRGKASVTLLVLFSCVILGSVHSHQIKRQILPGNLSFRCINTFLRFNESDRACLLRLGENINLVNATIVIALTPEQLDYLCGSSGCQRAFATLLEACEVCNEYTNSVYLV